MTNLTSVDPSSTKPRPPARPPAGLNPAGRALWARITKVLELDPGEVPLLAAACHQADDIAGLERSIKSAGVMVRGSKGQPRLSPAVAEVRQGRLALARLLSGISMPNEEGVPQTVRQRRATHAARTRWDRIERPASG
jgi:hypothetical protein